MPPSERVAIGNTTDIVYTESHADIMYYESKKRDFEANGLNIMLL